MSAPTDALAILSNPDAQLLELRRIARLALAEYAIEIRRVRLLLPLATNAIFRVDTARGPLALRVGLPGWRDFDDLLAEAGWMTALARDTAVKVPVPVHTRHGDGGITVNAPAGAHHVMLMSWLPGRLLGRQLTPANLFKMGVLFAQLHRHSGGWTPHSTFPQRRFDQIFSRGEAEIWQAAAERAGVARDDIALIGHVCGRVNTAYAALDPADRRVIHGDLHHDNVKVERGELCPFDFEDTVWGYRIHDIAMALLDLWDEVGAAAYDRLLGSFHRGYTTLEHWPDGDLTLFQLGRYVWRLNWTATHRSERVAAATVATAAAFRHTLDTGTLHAASVASAQLATETRRR